ncbi:RNA polymerase II transcription regulator [Malassezia pachydermatis]|uniref:Tpa: b-zip transcription factor n=1 Tax=Malassezia pachydermatis TaxID=77020 RepID=A0A0M9VQU2_9BASI|nr:b-zip transcription factor [Malassezia pachydermatis]KOS15875.1 b-zip transcription factor [Malassezia pachydermatis]
MSATAIDPSHAVRLGPPSPMSLPSSTDIPEVIKPSKEWVLPARGKPGRKPSASVPLTKRKAQNRASQRAFRERRSAYVTELEQKVAQYEAREIEANIQMQRIAQQYKEEATVLRSANEELKARCEQLEKQMQALLPSKIKSSPTQSHQSMSPPTIPTPTCAKPDPTLEHGSSYPLSSLPLKVSPHAKSASSPQTRAPMASVTSPSSKSLPTAGSVTDGAPYMQDAEEDDMEIDCGFCTDAEVCVCRGQARLDLGEAASNPPPSSTSTSVKLTALPLRTMHKPRLWTTTLESETPPKLASALPYSVQGRSTGNRSAPRARLWPYTDARAPPSTPSSTSSSTGMMCTGDPRHCRACNSDPALAEFCTEVQRTIRWPTSTQRQGTPLRQDSQEEGESIPHAFGRLRNHPNFSSWRGGLDILAEVVARDPVSHQISKACESTAQPTSASELPSTERQKPYIIVREEAVSEALSMLDKPDTATASSPTTNQAAPSRRPWPR